MKGRKAVKPARATRGSGARAREAPALAAAAEPAALRASVVLAAGVALLALLRAWGTLSPAMSLWGVDHARFLGPLFGWPLWSLAALAFVPPLARPAAAALDRLGDAFADSPWVASILAGAGAAAIVLSFPDRLRFVGDFLLRQGTVEESGSAGVLFPQALPLDVYLHVTLPSALQTAGWTTANGAARAIGTVEAALLAVLAIALARALALRGSAAVAVAAIVWWGGALSMYTGYSKAFGELAVLTLAAAVFALRSLRHGGAPLGLGLVLAIGLTLHRSALGLVVVWLAAWAIWARGPGRTGGWRRPVTWLALAIPLSALALMLPKIIATFLKWDAVHLTPAEVKEHGGPLRAAFAGRRPVDLANLLVVLVPLAPALFAAGLAFGRDLPRRREALLIAALVLPLAGVIPFIHPVGGLFRDWDDFVAAGVAIAVAGAWVAGEILRGAPRARWLAPALVLGCLVPALQWLGVQSDLARGLARVEAIVTGPPRRTGPEWGNTWDYLGIRNFRLERWDAAAAAFAHAAETSPSPRILRQWAFAESNRGNHEGAQRVFRLMAARNPDDYLAWSGLASESSRLSDAAASREAANQMLRIRPNDRDALMLLESIAEYERQHPGH